MHPLPPPPERAGAAQDQNSSTANQSQTTITPGFGYVGERSQGPRESTSAQAGQGQKRRKHRGGRKRRNRRQSFAAPSDDTSTIASLQQENLGGIGNGRTRSSATSTPFYKLGQPGANLSNTSLESEALLDHRDQPSLRPRRESRLGQNVYSAYRSSPPKAQQHNASSGLYPRRGYTDPVGLERNDDHEDDTHDRTPLLGGSAANHGARGVYGTPGRSASHKRPGSRSTTSSRRRRRGISREHSHHGAGLQQDYDVNNPPSMPGSPKLGADMGYEDVMVGGFTVPRSPEARHDQANDTIIDIDGRAQHDSGSGDTSPSPRLNDMARRRTLTLPVEEDVCFPLEEMSEIAEEDFTRAEPSEAGRGPRRRRRRWPDLSILEEWSAQEKEERSEGLRQMRINEPTLVNGRLRATKLAWHRAEEERPYRFTYFNEENEGTIHAQTISELVQPGGSFQELFIPEPPELTDTSSEEEDEEEERRFRVAPNDMGLSPKGGTRHNSLIGEARPEPKEGYNYASPQRPVGELKPKRYGPRPTFWLDVLSPTEEEMRIISKAFGIHALTAEDILLQEAREKVELFRNYYFINYRSFEQDVNSEEYLEPVNIYVVVFREGVLSFHFSQTPHPANVRRRIRQLKDYLILSSDWISYAIIDDVTDVFQPLIQSIEDEVDDIDDLILEMASSESSSATTTKDSEKQSEAGDKEPTSGMDMLRRVGRCRKKVMGLYRLLGNKADVIKGFAKRCNEQWEIAPKSEIGLYLGDIQDHILTMTSNLAHYETLLSRAHSNYLAQINIRMSDRAEQNADVLGKLTVLGTIVLPLNVICGMWGMNTKVPGQEVDNLNWFWALTAGMALFAITCYFVAKRVYKIV